MATPASPDTPQPSRSRSSSRTSFPPDDARSMSPRRDSASIARMSRESRSLVEEQARDLQASLMALVNRVETVKSEHSRLEGENRFLQSYIGELMSTSKITASGAPGSSGGKKKGGRK